MKTLTRFFVTLLIFGLLVANSDAQSRRKKIVRKKKVIATKSLPKPTPPMPNPNAPTQSLEDFKIIGQGSLSEIADPFVFVSRSAQTFSQLKKFGGEISFAQEIDFAKYAVVAAFAGTKPTAGYSVAIKKSGTGIRVELVEPPKGALLADVLTMPYKIAIVPVEDEQPLRLEVGTLWTGAMKSYRVASSSFEYSGGFVYREKKFEVEGSIGVLKFGNRISLSFNLTGKGADKERKITEIISGILKGDSLELDRLDAGTFSENPKPPFRVSGKITDATLALNFEPAATNVADGFHARGKLQANALK